MRQFWRGLLTAVGAALCGACLPWLARWGGPILISPIVGLSFILGAWRGWSAPLYLVLLTGSCAGVNYLLGRAEGSPGGRAEAFWEVWAILAVIVALPMLFGILLGWAYRSAGHTRWL